ncbi:MAG: hypothetical protein BAJATHORv1_40150 [Candidatus Thorarchaeota archaeon]|nr:MAG: hypothetical protein BAJATHORv1_40150 [Candidatus Thorarchaeota archaeon]
MVISEKKESSVIESDTTEDAETEYDIVRALQKTEHLTHTYENGLVLGVRLEGVTGTRGVHLDIVHILDLRKAEFGKTNLAMRAAVLESMNRSLESLLEDVGLNDFLEERTFITAWGRVRIPTIGSAKHNSRSMIHETRTVYVIVKDTKPSTDFSWLTETKRVVTPDEFALVRITDTKSLLTNLQKQIASEKWKILERGFRDSWLGIIFSSIILVGIGSIVGVLLVNNGNVALPIFAIIGGVLLGGYFLSSSRRHLSDFREMVCVEEQKLSEMSDKTRIEESVLENMDSMRLLGDLNFVVSPLMAKAGNALSDLDLDGAVSFACSVMDECMRLSSADLSKLEGSFIGGDEGIAKFVGLFGDLGAEEYETDLALAYVALTGYTISPISAEEVITHIATLNNALYHIGALRPDIKEIIDDLLNSRAGMEAVEYLNEELSKPEEPIPEPSLPSKKQEEATIEDKEDSSEELDALKEFITGSDCSTKSDEEEKDFVEMDDISTTGSDIVSRRTNGRISGDEKTE